MNHAREMFTCKVVIHRMCHSRDIGHYKVNEIFTVTNIPQSYSAADRLAKPVD